jgi:hypothetical protein
MNLRSAPLTLLILCTISACDHGLAPPSVIKPGFGGRIAYRGSWPPADSIKILAVVAFRHYPPSDIVGEVLRGEAVFDTALARNVDVQDYQIFTDPATFEYVIVAQQYGPNILLDWRIIGVYTDNPETFQPKSVQVQKETFVTNVNITVDFNHPPPQLSKTRKFP